jgi:two-component system, NarL family, sensor histidine kinase UhpB
MAFHVILDAGLKVSFACKTAENILGYSVSELQTMLFTDNIHPSDLPGFTKSLKELQNTPEASLSQEFRYKHKNGELLKIGVKAYSLLLDNSTKGIAIQLFHVSDQNLHSDGMITETSQESRDNGLRKLFESVNDGIVKTDLDGRIIEANRAYLDLLGVESFGEIYGTLKDYTPYKWHSLEAELLEQDEILEGYSREYEKEYKRKDGSVIPVHVRKWLIRDDAGKPSGIWAIVRRIEQPKQTSHQLQHTIEELSLLNHYQLNEREKERAAIASTIHDELGQAMTALKVDLGWLLESIDNREYCVEKIQKMLQITHDTIKLTQRVTSELRPGILDDLGLIPAIEWYCNEFEERSGIKCNIYLQSSCIHNRDIELNLFRILQESLTNVIRHAKASAVIVKLRCSPENVSLIIEDNGIGIPKEKLTSHKSFGLIGMRERAGYCNGTIKFESNNKGTIIHINIPLNNNNSSATGNQKSKPSATNTTRNESSDSRRPCHSTRRH